MQVVHLLHYSDANTSPAQAGANDCQVKVIFTVVQGILYIQMADSNLYTYNASSSDSQNPQLIATLQTGYIKSVLKTGAGIQCQNLPSKLSNVNH